MKVWSIFWRLLYALILGSLFVSIIQNGSEVVEIILPLCIGCLILNIPIYIYKKANETDASWSQSYIDWTYHPVRTVILGFLLAPIITIITIITLLIEAVQILFDRY